VEVDEKASGGGTGDRASQTRATDESSSTKRNTRRSTQRHAESIGNELQEVAQASGDALALHPMDAEADGTQLHMLFNPNTAVQSLSPN